MLLYYILKLTSLAANAQSCGPQVNGSYVLCAQLPGQPAAVTGPAEYISIFFKYGMGLVGLLGFAVLVWSGFNYIIQRGNYAKLTDIKDHIYQAVFGIVLLFASVLILNELDPSFTQIQDIKLKEIPRAQIEADLDAARRKQVEYFMKASAHLKEDIDKMNALWKAGNKKEATNGSAAEINTLLYDDKLNPDQRDTMASTFFSRTSLSQQFSIYEKLGDSAVAKLKFLELSSRTDVAAERIADVLPAVELQHTFAQLNEVKGAAIQDYSFWQSFVESGTFLHPFVEGGKTIYQIATGVEYDRLSGDDLGKQLQKDFFFALPSKKRQEVLAAFQPDTISRFYSSFNPNEKEAFKNADPTTNRRFFEQ